MKILSALILILVYMPLQTFAGEAEIVSVEVSATGDSVYRFDVTVSHSDEGWHHYVDKWDVLASDDAILGTRILYHPHVDEQPFTRSLSGVKISETTRQVRIRVHDSLHGFSKKFFIVTLPEKDR